MTTSISLKSQKKSNYTKPASFIIFLIITPIFVPIPKKIVVFDVFSSLTLAFSNPKKYYEYDFLPSKTSLDIELLMQN